MLISFFVLLSKNTSLNQIYNSKYTCDKISSVPKVHSDFFSLIFYVFFEIILIPSFAEIFVHISQGKQTNQTVIFLTINQTVGSCSNTVHALYTVTTTLLIYIYQWVPIQPLSQFFHFTTSFSHLNELYSCNCTSFAPVS